ncbi:MAG: hypothetical protein ACREVN_08195 [Gammaproteobacteria bacterium]
MKTKLGLACLALCAFSTVGAQQEVYVPAELEPWAPWVLEGQEFRQCPFLLGKQPDSRDAYSCAWPGALEIDVIAAGASFRQVWRIDVAGWVHLPGDTENWPQDVSVGGEAAAVVRRGARPAVWLEPGERTISGNVPWRVRPASLTIPPMAAIVRLTIDGAEVAQPRIRDAVLLFDTTQDTDVEPDSVRLSVYRQLVDGVPFVSNVRIFLEVSGRAREAMLGRAMPEGFAPLALDSPLPARLDADGRLRVQLRPGQWTLELRLRALEVPRALPAIEADGPWPDEEIWSYRSNDRLRVTSIEGGQAVDPAQTGVPADWRALPSFRVTPQSELRVVEKRRGLAGDETSTLRLSRQMWLDFDAGAFTTRDTIEGEMRRGWRLNVQPPYRLLSASLDEPALDPLLVTLDEETAQAGVEVRTPQLALNATTQVPRDAGNLPVTGWDTSFVGADATLHLPPGYRLIAASGADTAAGAWIEEWRLLDLFLVLVIAVAVGRLANPGLALIALAALTLTWHETFAPAWSWLNAIVALALARAVPEGRFKSAAILYRHASFALLLLLVIPFVADQMRVAIFPQLERSPMLAVAAAVRPSLPVMPAAQPPPIADYSSRAMEGYADEAADQGLITVTGSRVSPKYESDALVQAGPGVPEWSFHSHRLSFGGPVDPAQSFHAWILPRWALAFWRVLGVFLLVYVFLALVRLAYGVPRRLPLPGVSGTLVVAFLAFGLGTPERSHADVPPPFVLDALEERLTQPPECSPRCAELVDARVQFSPEALDIEIEAHALAEVAVPLPGSTVWRPQRVTVDGEARDQILRADENYWLRLSPGVRRVRLSGPLPPVDLIDVSFPEIPRRISATGSGWETAGVIEARLPSGSLRLIRIRAAGDAPAMRETSGQFPVFVKVDRNIRLDVEWTVHTSVERWSPTEGAFTVEVPLLDGERIISPGIEVRDGRAQVAMPAGQNQVDWQSTFARGDRFELTAGRDESSVESWSISASPTWHVETAGVPAIRPQTSDNQWAWAFRPLPGEALAVEIERPPAAEGSTLAIERATLDVDAGRRIAASDLRLTYRSTRGGRHDITLPPAAEVHEVLHDGNPIGIRPEGGVLPVNLEPGRHELIVRWRSPDTAGTRIGTPAVDVGSPASNLSLELLVPENRWILATTGPRLGPAVLYWAELVVLILVAIGLGRTRSTPLRTADWLLLGIGLSTFSWGVLLIFAAWLFLMAWRGRHRAELSPSRFNFVQLTLAVVSVIALASLVRAVPQGLLGTPDMHIVGNGSYGHELRWFQDRTDATLPVASAITAPLWLYKTAMLLWALWLSFALLRWLPWAWRSFTRDGIWRGRPDRTGAPSRTT